MKIKLNEEQARKFLMALWDDAKRISDERKQKQAV